MKRILALLIALMLLCGCGAQQTQEPETIAPETAEKTEQIAVTIPVEEDEGYDPYRCMSVFNRMALEWVYEPLFAVTQAGEAIPVLAESWSVSEDGLTTAVTIRSGIRLHSGAVLTAEDVVRSVRRAMSGSFYSGRFRLLSDMTAEGNTVLFQTEQAYECFPLLLDIPISGEIAEGETENGTGAYRMQGARLVRFEDWRGADSLPDAIGLSPVQSPQQLRDRFQYGAVTLAMQDPNGDQPLWFAGDFEAWDVPTSTLQFLGFNLQGGAFSNGGVRAAVTYAIDRSAIVAEDMGGYGVPTALTARPGTPWYDASLADTVSYDPSRLKEAAPSGAQAVMIVCSESAQRVASAKRIAEALTACGVSVTVRPLSKADYGEALSAGAFDLYYGEIRLSPDLDLAPILRSGYGGISAYSALSDLCDAARANSGNAYDLQKTILTDGILCPIAYKTAAVYGKRGLPITVTPRLNGWLFENPMEENQ